MDLVVWDKHTDQTSKQWYDVKLYSFHMVKRRVAANYKIYYVIEFLLCVASFSV